MIRALIFSSKSFGNPPRIGNRGLNNARLKRTSYTASKTTSRRLLLNFYHPFFSCRISLSMQRLPFLFGGYVTLPRGRITTRISVSSSSRAESLERHRVPLRPIPRFGESRCWKMVPSRGEVEPLTEKTLTLADNYFSHRFPARCPPFSFAADSTMKLSKRFQDEDPLYASMRVLSRV